MDDAVTQEMGVVSNQEPYGNNVLIVDTPQDSQIILPQGDDIWSRYGY